MHVDNSPPQLTSNDGGNSILGTPQNALTSSSSGNPILGATRDAQNRWHVVLSGTASDNLAGVASVEGLITPNGDGWQAATRNGNNWTLDYLLPATDADGNALTDATGQYTLSLRATDSLGNQTPAASTLQVPFRVDTQPPTADLRQPDPSTPAITQTLTLSGVITDTGSIAAGVEGLEVDFVPSGRISDTWRVAALAQHGPGVTSSI